MTERETARLLAIESATRDYIEWAATPRPEDGKEWDRWVDHAADLRRMMEDALKAKP